MTSLGNRYSAPRLAYLSFDVVPAPKGAATHIQAFSECLYQGFGALELVTIAPQGLETHLEARPHFIHHQLPVQGKTLIDRVMDFRHQLHRWQQGRRFDIIQIRSIYEGFPIAQSKDKWCNSLIFEVNGLPSIELKYRYPRVAQDRELLHKLTTQEQICFEAADLIITPSPVTEAYLIGRGVPPEKVRVIANGVCLDNFTYHAPSCEPELTLFKLLYFGTVSAWQGVAIALEALALYRRDFEATLTIIAPTRPQQRYQLEKMVTRLDLNESVHFLDPLPQGELVEQIHQADAVVAPLTANDRNLVQGCCPLKVLESMATGTPVISTNLPVVQALAGETVPFLAVRPGSAKAVKDAMLQLRNNPQRRLELAQAARDRIETAYTWTHAGQALIEVYRNLLDCPKVGSTRPEVLDILGSENNPTR
ncbi:glycosyltransferase family 1 protein [Geitlerinema sp. P-1104]|nr:glycosyltransferase [Geitlerinema sp. P-1104]NMG58761.1 glycosyltransferase family 1 protein [Geitlerinema sp. P-1104]